jgi:phospholipid transport system substrate-binding protein
MKTFLRSTVLALALASPWAALADTPESAPISALNTGLIATMKAGSAGQGFQARYDMLKPVVEKSYNLDEVAQNSVGFLWSTLPAAQQAELGQLFEQFTIASYVSQFKTDGGLTFKILPAEKTLGSKKIVETQLAPTDGTTPIEIDYVVAQGANGWQVTDVLLNGTISQVAIHNSDFSSLVTSGNASQLIAALKAKIAILSNSAGG